jgi:hypothetical protein
MKLRELKNQIYTLTETSNTKELKQYLANHYPNLPKMDFRRKSTWETLKQALEAIAPTKEESHKVDETTTDNLEEQILNTLKTQGDFQPIPEVRKNLGLPREALKSLHEAIFHLQRQDKIQTVTLQDAWEYTPDQQEEGIDNGFGPIEFFLELA